MIQLERPYLERPPRDQMLAIEHELRTPLGLVKGHLELLMAEEEPTEEALAKLNSAVLRLEQAIERMLDPEYPWHGHQL